MGWSQTVHENRRRAELQRAREELRLRKRGYDVESKPSAGTPAALALAGVLSAVAWWRRDGRRLGSGKDWKSLPGVSQLLDFLNSGGQPKRAVTRGKARPKQQLAPPGKAAAARQAAARPPDSGGGQQRASAAAGAAAAARASGGSGAGQAAAQMQQAAGAGSTQQQQGGGGKAKKKSGKKKKK